MKKIIIKKKELNEKPLRPCLDFFFLITHHSSLNFRNSSLITHHLKYPNFLYPPVQHTSLNFSSLNFSTFFVGPTPNVKPQLAYSRNIYSFQPFSPHVFPLQPTYSPRTLHKPNEVVDTIITIQLSCCFFFMPSSVTRAFFCRTERVQC